MKSIPKWNIPVNIPYPKYENEIYFQVSFMLEFPAIEIEAVYQARFIRSLLTTAAHWWRYCYQYNLKRYHSQKHIGSVNITKYLRFLHLNAHKKLCWIWYLKQVIYVILIFFTRIRNGEKWKIWGSCHENRLNVMEFKWII